MRCAALVNSTAGRRAFGSVSSGYANLLGPISGRGIVLFVTNSLDSEVVISLDAGTTDWMYLPAGTPVTIDLSTNGAEWSGSISVKHNGTAPTVGAIAASVLRIA
jgi:hypothetical protein